MGKSPLVRRHNRSHPSNRRILIGTRHLSVMSKVVLSTQATLNGVGCDSSLKLSSLIIDFETMFIVLPPSITNLQVLSSLQIKVWKTLVLFHSLESLAIERIKWTTLT